MATIWFEGIEELYAVEAELRRASRRIGARGARVLRASAHQVERLAKLWVPVDTGHLRSTIGPPEFSGDGRYGAAEAAISATARYAVYVEYGTRHMRPRPYMGAALDRVAPVFYAAVAAVADPLDGGPGG